MGILTLTAEVASRIRARRPDRRGPPDFEFYFQPLQVVARRRNSMQNNNPGMRCMGASSAKTARILPGMWPNCPFDVCSPIQPRLLARCRDWGRVLHGSLTHPYA
jgi:hypothetical protein